jgi:hypothetical protein
MRVRPGYSGMKTDEEKDDPKLHPPGNELNNLRIGAPMIQ